VVTPLARTANGSAATKPAIWAAGTDPVPAAAEPPVRTAGRHGNLFRAPYFFSYATFANILAEQLGYDDEVQILLTQGEGRPRITLRLSAGRRWIPARSEKSYWRIITTCRSSCSDAIPN